MFSYICEVISASCQNQLVLREWLTMVKSPWQTNAISRNITTLHYNTITAHSRGSHSAPCIFCLLASLIKQLICSMFRVSISLLVLPLHFPFSIWIFTTLNFFMIMSVNKVNGSSKQLWGLWSVFVRNTRNVRCWFPSPEQDFNEKGSIFFCQNSGHPLQKNWAVILAN